MSVVDLIKSSQIQLAPFPTLQNEFNKATDSFFNQLSDLEIDSGEQDQSIVQKEVKQTRSAIEGYKTTAQQVLFKYEDEQDKRLSVTEKAKASVAGTLDKKQNATDTSSSGGKDTSSSGSGTSGEKKDGRKSKQIDDQTEQDEGDTNQDQGQLASFDFSSYLKSLKNLSGLFGSGKEEEGEEAQPQDAIEMGQSETDEVIEKSQDLTLDEHLDEQQQTIKLA